MALRNSLIISLLLYLSSCTYLRETPSYREEGHQRSGSSPTRSPRPASKSTLDAQYGQDFYQVKSQKLGYRLNGNEQPELLMEITRWLGTPYRHGGTTSAGVDCSGLANIIYRRVYNIDLERVTVNMAQNSRKVNRRQLREGDLVFFKINNRKVSHVGVYISNNKFVHASTSRGVIISDLNEEYYQRRFAFGGRIARR